MFKNVIKILDKLLIPLVEIIIPQVGSISTEIYLEIGIILVFSKFRSSIILKKVFHLSSISSFMVKIEIPLRTNIVLFAKNSTTNKPFALSKPLN